jgi:methylenetetrahydrofolate reductase (NADPH)
MKIIEILKSGKKSFSFEFFPPKTDEDAAQLMKTAEALRALEPGYISVTWGAGGSTRRKTLDLVVDIKAKLGVETMAHLTCVGASRMEIDAVLEEVRAKGVDNILALRGDPPKGQTAFVPHPDGFAYADQLVAHIRARNGVCIGVAGYPEGHPETPDKRKDLDNLKRKVDAGADFIVTQLFFDNKDYFSFVERARRSGVGVPIVPGLMPVTNVAQLKRFTAMCGASIPKALADVLEPLQADPDAVVRAGIDYGLRQSAGLMEGGAPGIHFYTLNRSRSTAEILRQLPR